MFKYLIQGSTAATKLIGLSLIWRFLNDVLAVRFSAALSNPTLRVSF
jgi:hypothetical protein